MSQRAGLTPAADLHLRARELEDQASAIRRELDALYSMVAVEDADSFMARMADRFRDERDAANREVAELKAKLSSRETDAEVRANLLEAHANELDAKLLKAKGVVRRVLNEPTSSRERVQSSLLLLNEEL